MVERPTKTALQDEISTIETQLEAQAYAIVFMLVIERTFNDTTRRVITAALAQYKSA